MQQFEQRRANGELRTYRYFRRPDFPIISLPGEPGSAEFRHAYRLAMKADTREEAQALRDRFNLHQERKRHVSRKGNQIVELAERGELTCDILQRLIERKKRGKKARGAAGGP